MTTKKKPTKSKISKTKSKAVKTSKLVNHFMICLDSSGSMSSIREETVRAFNENVEAIRTASKDQKQKSTVSLITFGERSAVSVKYIANDVNTLKPMSPAEFRPDGGTPMLDAIGDAITNLSKLKTDKNASYVVMCLTDGEENQSSRYSKFTIGDLMREKNATDRWSFVFLVPPGSSHRLISNWGIPAGNIKEWEASSAGVKLAAAAVSSGIGNYLRSRSVGKTSTQGFFTANLDKVRVQDLKANLTNIAGDVHTLSVPAEVDIRTFVEKQGLPFVKGNGFYQLTKPETVQAYKEIMIKEKNGRAIYGGQDARSVLGFPEGANFKFKPGNMGNYDLFVQSTSVNRKLVRGTTLLYKRY